MKNGPMRALAVVAVLTVGFVWAVTPATLSWEAPTSYLDGTVLPSTDIDHYTVRWTAGPGGSGPVGTVQVKALSAQVPIPCGSVQFTVTATTGATAAYPNTTSDPAGPVPFASGVVCAPHPPGALAVH